MKGSWQMKNCFTSTMRQLCKMISPVFEYKQHMYHNKICWYMHILEACVSSLLPFLVYRRIHVYVICILTVPSTNIQNVSYIFYTTWRKLVLMLVFLLCWQNKFWDRWSILLGRKDRYHSQYHNDEAKYTLYTLWCVQMYFSEDGFQFMKCSLVQWFAMVSIGKKYLLWRTSYITLQSFLQGLFCSSRVYPLTSLCGFHQRIFSSQKIASEGCKWKIILRSVLAPYLVFSFFFLPT